MATAVENQQSSRSPRTPKIIATANRLIDACVEELHITGYGGLTVRNVASRAGVAPATAYNHFNSREFLVTEVFWRRLQALPDTPHGQTATTVERVSAVLEDLACVVADEPELASACTAAMLSSEPEVKRIRDRIGGEYHRRLGRALGPNRDNEVLTTLELALSGAMLHAGMGHLSYENLPGQLRRVASLILSKHNETTH